MAESLGSRYVLGEALGRGAMGQVFAGTIRSTGEPVAVKVLRPELVSDHETVARFIQERGILMSIADANVVRVIDLVIEGDTLAIVMELVQGSDLRRLLRARHTVPPSEALHLTGQVLRGMAAVHAAGIVHRDIKPENVLVDNSSGQPLLKLTDFGIARLSYGSSLTKVSGVIGTPEYMAPELVEGNRATPAADVYSAGIVLYEMLCGRTPFAGGHPVAVLRRQADQAPPVIPDVPADLWNVIASMLAKDPRSRPASAERAYAALAPLESSLASWPALAPWAGPEDGAEGPGTWSTGGRGAWSAAGPDAGSRTVTTPGASRVSPQDRVETAPGATVLRHRDRGDVAASGAFGVPAPWSGGDDGSGSVGMGMAAAPSRRKRQVQIAVLAVALAAVLGLVTTVAMAATHRTTAQNPTAGGQTTTATSSMSASAAVTPAKGTGTGTAVPGSTASAGGTSAGGVSAGGVSAGGVSAGGGSGSGASGSGTSGSSVSSGGGKTGTSGSGSTGSGSTGSGSTGSGSTGSGSTGTGSTGTGSTGTGSTGTGTGTGSTGTGSTGTGSGSAPALTAAEQQLADQLNPAMFYDCAGRPDLAIYGAVAALNCSSGTVLAQRPAVFTFASGDAQTWFKGWTSTFKTGTNCTGGAYIGTWSRGGVVAGQLACGIVPGGYLRIVWVVGDQLGFVGEGSDATAVYDWWKTDSCGVTNTAEC